MPSTFGIVDLFAGPGGLGEGFASVGREGDGEMQIRLSVERQPIEVRTLRLRAFLRRFENGFPKAYHDALNSGATMPDWSDLHPAEWKAAEAETWQLELGAEGSFERISDILDRTREEFHGNTILIGGRPAKPTHSPDGPGTEASRIMCRKRMSGIISTENTFASSTGCARRPS